jgi:hypothetical protein
MSHSAVRNRGKRKASNDLHVLPSNHKTKTVVHVMMSVHTSAITKTTNHVLLSNRISAVQSSAFVKSKSPKAHPEFPLLSDRTRVFIGYGF